MTHLRVFKTDGGEASLDEAAVGDFAGGLRVRLDGSDGDQREGSQDGCGGTDA